MVKVSDRKLVEVGNWVNETPIPRWTDIDPEKLTKDYFLSALDEISRDNGTIKASYSFSIQNNITKTWRKIIGNDPERFFFYYDRYQLPGRVEA